MRRYPLRSMIVGLFVSALLLWAAVRAVPLRDVAAQIGKVSLSVLSLSLVCRLIALLAATARSHLLVRGQKALPLRLLFNSHLVGFAANNVLPLRAGELVRIDYLARLGGLSRTACLPVIAAERLLDIAALGLLALVSAPFMSAELPLAPSVYMSLALAFTGIGSLTAARLRPQAFVALCTGAARLLGPRAHGIAQTLSGRVADGLAGLPGGIDAGFAVLLSVVMWVISTLSVFVWLWAFGLDLPWYTAPLIVVFLAFGLALPATPGHIGTYHYFVAAALSVVGLDRVGALSVAVVGHAVAVIPFSLLAMPILVAGFAYRPTTAEPAEARYHA